MSYIRGMNLLNILLVIALLAVGAALVAGIFFMTRVGPGGRVASNRMMRYRIIAQAVAVVVILAILYFTGQ